jgi:ribonucleotide reductase alpha subunit
MSKQFIFLEILDPDIYAFIKGLKSEFGMFNDNSNIHITVRGPYKGKIDYKKVNNFYDKIKNDPIIIQNAGIFNNEDESVVYFKVDSLSLRKIWRKPDYPISKYGYNPHVSVYRGSDKELAKKIYDFLKSQNIVLMTYDFHLTTFVSKQNDLFADINIPTEKYFLDLANKRLIKDDFLQKAHNLIKNHLSKNP